LGALDSFSRTLNMPAGFPRQLELLKAAHTLPFDVGRVSCHDSRGQPVTRYFLNGARLGLPGELRGELRDLLRRPRAALAGIGEVLKRHLRKSESLVMSGEERVLYHGPSPLVLIMGGRYYPGLGDTVPQGRQGDGLLQVGWIESEGLLGGVPRLISLHLPWPLRRRLSRWRSLEYFSVAPDSGRCSLELDGQPAGYLPAEFSMERKALHLIVEPVAARLGERVESLAGRMKEKGLVGSAMGRNSA
ncbi:MAG: hypothetical protein OEZ59_12455, partial [Deltaproteobacteria bacterium]|nr:hypothetical protein [Deltaproteobacteria bacterium]